MKKARSLAYICIFMLLLAGVFAAGCGGGGGVAEGGEHLVRNVIDGDTIELAGGSKVRYTGIDTPETMKRVGSGWLFMPETYGVAAKDHNRELVSGKKVTLEFDKVRQDKYGRVLAYVYVDGQMANLEMIKGGYATVYTFPPNVKHLNAFLDAQEDARRNKRGLWGTVRDVTPDKAGDHAGEFASVKGIVTNVHVAPHAIFLNFGPDRTRYLTAVIYGRNIPLFSEKGIDPSGHYRGRYVEVVGKIEDRNGPRMVIDNPSQIRLIADK